MDQSLEQVRRRTLAALFASSAAAGIGMFSAFTVANVLGAELLGGATWAGLPGTFILIGSAAASILLSSYMARAGRRPGLVAGYAVGVAGSALAVWSAEARSFPLLMVAMVLFGFGGTSIQLSRYAAADVSPTQRRGKAISLVTWASVAGAVIGPNLVGPAGRIAHRFGLPRLAGPYLLCIAGFSVAALIVISRLRPDPLDVARRMATEAGTDGAGPRRATRLLLGLPRVQIAIVSMAVGQLVMVMVMSMTAVHMRAHELTWTSVGIVISAHMLGMFALSPLSGWASDRLGRVPVIISGAFTLLAAALLAATAGDSQLILMPALFLLGFGWNLGNIAGSALLTDSVEQSERAPMQGIAELFGSGVSAVSSMISGLILGAVGFANLSVIGAALVVIPLVLIAGRRRSLRLAPGLSID